MAEEKSDSFNHHIVIFSSFVDYKVQREAMLLVL